MRRVKRLSRDDAASLLALARANRAEKLGLVNCMFCGDAETVGENETKLHYECEALLNSMSAPLPFSFPVIEEVRT